MPHEPFHPSRLTPLHFRCVVQLAGYNRIYSPMSDEAPQRKRRKPFLARVVILLTLAFICFAFWSRQPRYNGRTLNSWLNEMNAAGGLEECQAALQAINAMGPGTLPFLLNNIRGGAPSRWEEWLFKVTERSGALAQIIPHRMLNLSPTCLALRELGTNASPILPELERLFLGGNSGGWPGLALLSIGSNAAPAFVNGCKSETEDERALSALFLAKVVDGREEWWSWAWANSPKSGRKQLSLGFVTLNDADAETLARHLAHENPNVRRATAEALKHYGRYHSSAMIALQRARTDPDPTVRQAVKEALYMFEIWKRNNSTAESSQ